MVNAIPIYKGFLCEKCRKEYIDEDYADKCCEKKKTDWGKAIEFELKQIHLDLLKETAIDWNDCEFGAPCVDPKRPYGNSDVEDDIAKIIKLSKKGNWDFEEEMWNENASDYMEDLHKQMQIVLEIVLHCQSFKLGKYIRESVCSHKWVFVNGI